MLWELWAPFVGSETGRTRLGRRRPKYAIMGPPLGLLTKAAHLSWTPRNEGILGEHSKYVISIHYLKKKEQYNPGLLLFFY